MSSTCESQLFVACSMRAREGASGGSAAGAGGGCACN